MPFPYDATTKFFMSLNLKDWLVLVGETADLEVTELNADLSTVSTAADKLFRVEGAHPRIEHIEIISGWMARIPVRVCRYGILALYEYKLPVNSTVILLRSEANSPELNGVFEDRRNDVAYLQYRYNVVRIWEIPVEFFLDAGIGLLALAPLSKIEESDLPALIRRTQERVEDELPEAQRRSFWTGLSILMGLKFESQLVKDWLKGVIDMKESSVVQAFLNEGREEEARKVVLHTIKRRLGDIPPEVQRTINSLKDLSALEVLLDRVIDAQSRDELLAVFENSP